MKKYLLFFIALGTVLFLNLYFRSFPINFPQFQAQANNIVNQRIARNVIQMVDKKYPHLSGAARDNFIAAALDGYKKEGRREIENEIGREHNRLKDRYQDKNGQTYLSELDCWNWAVYVENMVKYGHPGDKVVNGKDLDSFALAPAGTYLAWCKLIFYLPAFLYRAFCLVRAVPVNTFLFYMPLLFSAIFITCLFIFCFYRWGAICAVISCLFVGLAPIFLFRSSAGWFDTDILNLLFPLLILWSYLLVYDAATHKLKLFWLALCGFWVGLFCFTWSNWWFIFLIIIIYELYSILNTIFARWQFKEENTLLIKKHLICLFLFVTFSFFWVIVFSGTDPLFYLYSQVRGALTLNQPLTVSIWPNVLSTVGELRKASMQDIARFTGGTFLFLGSILSLLVLFLRSIFSRNYSDSRRECIVILAFWFLSMLFACSRGVRFVLFLLIPLGVALGWVLEEAYLYFKNKNMRGATLLSLVIIFGIGINFIPDGESNAKKNFPLMTDNWYLVLNTIKETTPPDAVVNSWWDFGDWFKAVARRRVIFDGQSQNMPQAYWMARVLLTDNEEEAVRILRMLNNGGNKAFEIIDKELRDPFKSVLLLKKIMLDEPKRAKETLLKFLPAAAVDGVMKLLSDKPAKAYFVVDYTMPNNIYPISTLGNWDFTKLYIAENIYKKKRGQIIDYLQNLGIDNKTVENFYDQAAFAKGKDISGWISRGVSLRNKLLNARPDKGLVFFERGLVYNPKEEAIYLYSAQEDRYKIPQSLFIAEKGKLREITYPERDLDFSVLLFNNNNTYQALMLDTVLARSMFVRLYFFNAKGLKHFKPFIENIEGDNYIRVFEINWE